VQSWDHYRLFALYYVVRMVLLCFSNGNCTRCDSDTVNALPNTNTTGDWLYPNTTCDLPSNNTGRDLPHGNNTICDFTYRSYANSRYVPNLIMPLVCYSASTVILNV